jgi:hypothetical protein
MVNALACIFLGKSIDLREMEETEVRCTYHKRGIVKEDKGSEHWMPRSEDRSTHDSFVSVLTNLEMGLERKTQGILDNLSIFREYLLDRFKVIRLKCLCMNTVKIVPASLYCFVLFLQC